MNQYRLMWHYYFREKAKPAMTVKHEQIIWACLRLIKTIMENEVNVSKI